MWPLGSRYKSSIKIFIHHFSGVSFRDLPLLPLLSILHIYFLFLWLSRCQGHCYRYTPPALGKWASEILCEIWPGAKFLFLLIIFHHTLHWTKYYFFFFLVTFIPTSPPIPYIYMYIQTYAPSYLFSYLVILKIIGKTGPIFQREEI